MAAMLVPIHMKDILKPPTCRRVGSCKSRLYGKLKFFNGYYTMSPKKVTL